MTDAEVSEHVIVMKEEIRKTLAKGVNSKLDHALRFEAAKTHQDVLDDGQYGDSWFGMTGEILHLPWDDLSPAAKEELVEMSRWLNGALVCVEQMVGEDQWPPLQGLVMFILWCHEQRFGETMPGFVSMPGDDDD